MSDLERVNLAVPDDGRRVQLHRYADMPESIPVLLLHGASANRGSFTIPDGGLAAWLVEQNFEPWFLDWRGSGLVVDDLRDARLRADADNFNRAADTDVPAAIGAIRSGQRHPWRPRVAVLGHCMGGGILAEAIARGTVTATDVSHVVLMALGLFYETPIDGRLKSNERLLEQIEVATHPDERPTVDPRVQMASGSLKKPWPTALDRFYESWPPPLKSHLHEPTDDVTSGLARQREAVNEMCNRLSFMYGAPYHHDNLAPEIHGSDSVRPLLPDQFGAIPLHMYIHGAKNIRRGHATFDNPTDGRNEDIVSDEARENFRKLEKVTLITGALNRLWHRDSIDLMYEWLCRGTSDHLRKFRKCIVPKYGHQDLLWGRCAKRDVFPLIGKGLGLP